MVNNSKPPKQWEEVLNNRMKKGGYDFNRRMEQLKTRNYIIMFAVMFIMIILVFAQRVGFLPGANENEKVLEINADGIDTVEMKIKESTPLANMNERPLFAGKTAMDTTIVQAPRRGVGGHIPIKVRLIVHSGYNGVALTIESSSTEATLLLSDDSLSSYRDRHFYLDKQGKVLSLFNGKLIPVQRR